MTKEERRLVECAGPGHIRVQEWWEVKQHIVGMYMRFDKIDDYWELTSSEISFWIFLQPLLQHVFTTFRERQQLFKRQVKNFFAISFLFYGST